MKTEKDSIYPVRNPCDDHRVFSCMNNDNDYYDRQLFLLILDDEKPIIINNQAKYRLISFVLNLPNENTGGF